MKRRKSVFPLGFQVLLLASIVVAVGACLRCPNLVAGDESDLKRTTEKREKKPDAETTDGNKENAKERARREQREKINAEIIKILAERRKRNENIGDSELTAAEKKKIAKALEKMRKERERAWRKEAKEKKREPETGDEKSEDNTDKFDGDIDIDPEDDWDEDPELFGD